MATMHSPRPRARALASYALPLTLALALGCGASQGPSTTPAPTPVASAALAADPPSPALAAPAPGPALASTRYRPPAQRLGRAQIREVIPSGARITREDLAASHRVSFASPAPLDPGPVPGVRTVQDSRFSLTPDELALLRTQRFAISSRHRFPNFMTGYAMLYIADQPVYLSADAVLNALHLSFDSMVAEIEEDALGPAVDRALSEAHRALAGPAGASLASETRVDIDGYLALTLSLLRGSLVAPVAGAESAPIETAFRAAERAEGAAPVAVFGSTRATDFSQFRPRGHYAGNPVRERYFRAVMWLGREGLRLVDSAAGRPRLDRRAVAGALALDALLTPAGRESLALVDAVVGAFAGEAESLGMRDLAALRAQIASRGGLASVDDASLSRMIDAQRGERPRIATTLLHHPEGLEQSAFEPVAFSLSPQRYTPDSLVLSRVSYDRILGGRVMRMMPESLDAAFGALGNDQALALLEPSLRRYDYATELATVRNLVDAHEEGYWSGSLYAHWLGALRALSPRETLASAGALPATMRSDAWGRRLMNTQLAAWSEVRHDLVLYLAQSYSAVPGCSYPAAYVEPYPAFWNALSRWATRAEQLVQQVPWATAARRDAWLRWARHARSVLPRIEAMAERERDGQELTTEQLAFMNQALNAREVDAVCTRVTTVDGGWFYELFQPRLELGDERSMVADVHTQPADEVGNSVGNVLHIGTGQPRTMVVIAGPEGRQRAYVGLASTYLERTTSGFDRLTDERWRQEIERAQAPAWMRPVLGR